MKALDIEISASVMESLQGLHTNSHVLYLASAYFIKSVGQEASLDKVVKVAVALGAVPDYATAGAAVSFYKTYGEM